MIFPLPPSQEALSHPWFNLLTGGRKSHSGGLSSNPSIKSLDSTGLGNIMLQRLRSYAKMTSFQQEVMRVAVKQLDGAHLAGIKVGEGQASWGALCDEMRRISDRLDVGKWQWDDRQGVVHILTS